MHPPPADRATLGQPDWTPPSAQQLRQLIAKRVPSPPAPSLGEGERPGWKLTWSDEFNSGTAPDPSKWSYDLGGDGFGNHELEYYTNRPENVEVKDGNLVITARKEQYTGPDQVTREYTSARLKTQGIFDQQYGRFEARIKLPEGQGMWPAYWMLGSNINQAGWPGGGEIDIMENVGNEPSRVHGTVHGPGYSGADGIGKSFDLPDGQKFSDDFHVFSVEWSPETVKFMVDDQSYQTLQHSDLPPGAPWVYDHPFFTILNLAVGGDWPGAPDDKTQFPQKMLVDYVRAYQPDSK